MELATLTYQPLVIGHMPSGLGCGIKSPFPNLSSARVRFLWIKSIKGIEGFYNIYNKGGEFLYRGVKSRLFN